MATFGSLFAGIGGIDLGLERAGWECRWQVEWDDWCRSNLAAHWPDVPRYGDIRAIDWTDVEPVDLIAGGFPCQPVSNAGRRAAQADPRWLWPEFARCVSVLRPRLVLVENVPGLVARGLGDVLGDLDTLGYYTSRGVISAADAGAPHLRERLFVVAHARGERPGRAATLGPPGIAGIRPGEARTEPDGADRRALADGDEAGWRVAGEGDERQRSRARRDASGAGRDPLAHPGRRDGRPWGPWGPEHGGEGLPEPERPYDEMADPRGGRRDGLTGIEGQGPTGRGRAGESREVMADGDGGGREGVGLTEYRGESGASRHQSDGRGARGWGDGAMADAHGQRGRGRDPRWTDVDAPGEGVGPGGDGERRPTEPGLGRGTDGLSAGLDGHRWPAPPGEAQYDWEPSRLAVSVHNRRVRLQALGNAVVPQVVEVIGRQLLAALELPA